MKSDGHIVEGKPEWANIVLNEKIGIIDKIEVCQNASELHEYAKSYLFPTGGEWRPLPGRWGFLWLRIMLLAMSCISRTSVLRNHVHSSIPPVTAYCHCNNRPCKSYLLNEGPERLLLARGESIRVISSPTLIRNCRGSFAISYEDSKGKQI